MHTHIHTHMHVTAINKKEVMNLKERKEREVYRRVWRKKSAGGNEPCNYILISKK